MRLILTLIILALSVALVIGLTGDAVGFFVAVVESGVGAVLGVIAVVVLLKLVGRG